MTAYLIAYGAEPSDRFVAYAYPNRTDAWQASTNPRIVPGVPVGSHAGGCAYVIETAEDVTLSGRLLMDVYEELTGALFAQNTPRDKRIRMLMEALRQQAVPTKADTVPLSEEPKRQRGRPRKLVAA